jgi:glyoxylase-like metal-dependent hydrolase (beta-lactamase superfamily II)
MGRKIMPGLEGNPLPLASKLRPKARHFVAAALTLASAMFALSLMARAQEPLPPEDQWFQVQKIDDRTFAIKEVHYWQYNVNYLILGSERAILFDTGPGVYSIRKVVETLTKMPVTVLASHLHFDHVGNHQEFDRIALPDQPDLREQTVNGRFTLSHIRHLYDENTSFRVAEWWKEGQVIDLGGRKLEVLFLPGHTEESTGLLDHESDQLFSGDYINKVGAWAIVPGYSLEAYVATAGKLAAKIDGETVIWEAHGDQPLNRADIINIGKEAQSILDGTGKGTPLRIGGLDCLSYQNFGRVPLIAPAHKGEALRPVRSVFDELAVINPQTPK